MRQLLAIQRQIQDIELAVRNDGRVGKVTEVKFDKEKQAWFARMQQSDGDEAYVTDWLPWKSFAHGTIKISIPPRKGQLVELDAPGGSSEQGSLRPAHYDPDNKSPHDKEDEIFLRIEEPEQSGSQGGAGTAGATGTTGSGQQKKKLDVLVKNNQLKIVSGKTTHDITENKVSIETETKQVTSKTSSEKTETHSVETKNRTVKAQNTDIKSATYKVGGKVLINC